MKKNAPHLPSRSCRVDTYYRLQNIKWILLFAFFAFVAGASAALVFSAWVVPNYNYTSNYNTNFIDRGMNRSQPDIILERQMSQRVFTIHDKRKKIGSQFYGRESFVSLAGVVSSDGWLVTRVNNYLVGAEKNWEILDNQHLLYTLEKAVYDRLDQLLYLKIKADGLRVVAFPSWLEMTAGDSVWQVSFSGWSNNTLKNKIKISEKNLFTVWQPQYYWQLWDEVTAGSLVFNNRGELLGIVGTENTFSPGWLIEKQTNALLGSGKLVYYGVPWQGYFVSAKIGEAGNINGFYVERNTAGSAVLRGDIILKINGLTLAEDSLAELVWLAPDNFRVLVWRAGEELELEVSKLPVSL